MKKCFVFLFIIGWGVVYAQDTTSVYFYKQVHDFGEVKVREQVYTTFKFKNTGKYPLKIHNVQSSCGCTTPDWPKEPIPPGKEGEIKVLFESFALPKPFDKSVAVFANTYPEVSVLIIKGKTVDKDKSIEEAYPNQSGNLRFTTNHVAFDKVFENTTDTGYFKVYNHGKSNIAISGFNVPEYITCEIFPTLLHPGDEANLTAVYHGPKAKEYGFKFDKGVMMTSDEREPNKMIYFSAHLQQYFDTSGKVINKDAPHIEFIKTQHAFGKMKEGEKATVIFEFKNTGKQDLVIKKVAASCGCTATELDNYIIKKGGKARLKVTYNSVGRSSGMDYRHVTVISNDPKNPEVDLSISADIEVKQ